MKKNIFGILAVVAAAFLWVGCSDWTDTEGKKNDLTDLGTLRDAEYYRKLRAWKAEPQTRQSFVWFDQWVGGTSGPGSLSGLPDSLTIASNWGGSWPLTDAQVEDMQFVQKTKGTKVVVTLLSGDIGQGTTPPEIYTEGYEGLTGYAAVNRYWDLDSIPAPAGQPWWKTKDPVRIDKAVREHARRIYDSVAKWGYDGFDWDYEPAGGHEFGPGRNPEVDNNPTWLWRSVVARKIFVDELTYWFGVGNQRADRGNRTPAKPGLLLQIDGEIGIRGNIDRDWPVHLIDNYILQAYNSSGYNDLTSRVRGVINVMSDNEFITPEEIVRRTIVTENFESYANWGGNQYGATDYEGNRKNGLQVMAEFIYDPEGLNVQIGGFGVYRVGFDYAQGKGDFNGSPEYYYLRQGLSAMNRIRVQRDAEGLK